MNAFFQGSRERKKTHCAISPEGKLSKGSPQQAAVAELPLVKGNFTTDDEERKGRESFEANL